MQTARNGSSGGGETKTNKTSGLKYYANPLGQRAEDALIRAYACINYFSFLFFPSNKKRLFCVCFLRSSFPIFRPVMPVTLLIKSNSAALMPKKSLTVLTLCFFQRQPDYAECYASNTEHQVYQNKYIRNAPHRFEPTPATQAAALFIGTDAVIAHLFSTLSPCTP